MSLDRQSAAWAWALGAHPTRSENPFRDGSDHWLAFQAGASGLPFPEHLVVEPTTEIPR